VAYADEAWGNIPTQSGAICDTAEM